MPDVTEMVSASPGGSPPRLPAEPNSFVGRARDLADLAMLLAEVRMLSLCGPGGIGKTRLAIRLASQLADRFGGGVWLVELAEVTDPALIWNRVAAAVGIREEPETPLPDTLTAALRQRHSLLLLDTCEHLVGPVAEVASRLLADCRTVTIVATSREPLRVSGETVWRVPPLTLPPAGPFISATQFADLASYEAVRLFLDRAAAVRPGFSLTSHNAGAVMRMCRTLDGVPLAIELAAARMRALSAEQLASRLDDRFRLLSSGDRTAPPRQQTLLAAVDWSHGLLTPGEQALLRRLAVFSGWNLEMAERVCAGQQVPAGHVLDLLASLIDKSLVTLDGEADGVSRYRLLDTIREYAATRLARSGEATDVRLRHLDLMLRLAEDAIGLGFRRGDPAWPQRILIYRRTVRELPNFRTALGTALDQRLAEQGLRLCAALRAPWVADGDVSEGVIWFDRFLRMAGEVPPAARATALVSSAELAFEQQDYATVTALAQAALDIRRETGGRGSAAALRLLAVVDLRAGRPAAALPRVEAAVAAARADQDDWEEGLGLTARATVLARLGRPDEAAKGFEQALSVLADNNRWGYAQALYGHGSLARARGDNLAALRHLRGALDLFGELGSRTGLARCQSGLGSIALAAGDHQAAAASLGQSLRLSVATGQRLGIARGLDAIAALAVAVGEPATAARLAGVARALRDQVGSAPALVRPDEVIEAARRRLGEQVTARLLAEGTQLSQDDAVEQALALAAAVQDGVAGGPAPGGAPAGSGTGSADDGRASQHGVLTRRELEIARLVARGLPNRAIAAELVIAPATVNRHVANIFAKLGLASRAELAAWIAEHSQPPT